MSELQLAPGVDQVGAAGVVGRRQLVCVQTLDIARLTAHPVALVPGAFVAVGGRGPKGDSNESGKTSFLAAVSLLLGDPEWRLGGGGAASVSALLFEPETAGTSAQRFQAAQHG
jgi:chromosome segregation protein